MKLCMRALALGLLQWKLTKKRISPSNLESDDTSQPPFPYMLQIASHPPPNIHTHTQSGSVRDVRSGQRRKRWCYCTQDRRGQGVPLAMFVELNTSCWQFSSAVFARSYLPVRFNPISDSSCPVDPILAHSHAFCSPCYSS